MLLHLISFIFILLFLQSNAKLCTYSIISPSKAWKRSGSAKEFLWRLCRVCISLCICMCVFQGVRSLLSASERLISLIEAHHRPSTLRPRGIAAETHKALIKLKYLSIKADIKVNLQSYLTFLPLICNDNNNGFHVKYDNLKINQTKSINDVNSPPFSCIQTQPF